MDLVFLFDENQVNAWLAHGQEQQTPQLIELSPEHAPAKALDAQSPKDGHKKPSKGYSEKDETIARDILAKLLA